MKYHAMGCSYLKITVSGMRIFVTKCKHTSYYDQREETFSKECDKYILSGCPAPLHVMGLSPSSSTHNSYYFMFGLKSVCRRGICRSFSSRVDLKRTKEDVIDYR